MREKKSQKETPGYEHVTQERQDVLFDMDVAMRRALLNDQHILLMPEMGLEIFPPGLGDTLFLQTSFLHNISLPHNLITSILNTELPQLSLYHLRYVRELNLSGNKLRRLPADIGALKLLTLLNLENNQLSAIPPTISRLKVLREIKLNNNNFATMAPEISLLDSLQVLDLSSNLLQLVPSAVVKLPNLRHLDLSKNVLPHFAIQPALLKMADLWFPYVDDLTGEKSFINILTKEKIKHITLYDGKGITKMKALHVFQKYGTTNYRRRKMWLSACQVYEFDALEDPESGLCVCVCVCVCVCEKSRGDTTKFHLKFTTHTHTHTHTQTHTHTHRLDLLPQQRVRRDDLDHARRAQHLWRVQDLGNTHCEQ